MTLARAILVGFLSGAAFAAGATAVIWFAPTMAGDNAPINWAVEGPYRQTVIEEAIVGPYTPGRLWIVDERGDCGVAWNCGSWWTGVDAEPESPAPVPLPPAVWLLAMGLAALWAIRRM